MAESRFKGAGWLRRKRYGINRVDMAFGSRDNSTITRLRRPRISRLALGVTLRVYEVTRREIFVRPERATEMMLVRVLKRAVSVLSSAYLHESRTYGNFRQIVCSESSAGSNEPIILLEMRLSVSLRDHIPPNRILRVARSLCRKIEVASSLLPTPLRSIYTFHESLHTLVIRYR